MYRPSDLEIRADLDPTIILELTVRLRTDCQ